MKKFPNCRRLRNAIKKKQNHHHHNQRLISTKKVAKKITFKLGFQQKGFKRYKKILRNSMEVMGEKRTRARDHVPRKKSIHSVALR